MADKKKDKEKTTTEEIKSEFITSEKVTDAVNFSIENYSNINNFVQLAEYLRTQQEFGLCLIVCKNAQTKLKTLEEDRVKRELRHLKVEKIEKKLNEKREKEKIKGDLGDAFTEGESNLWKWIQLEKSVINLLPKELKLTQNDNFNYQLRIAKIMIGSVQESIALKEAAMIDAGKEVDDVALDTVLQKVIERCTTHVINPSHLREIAVLLSGKGKYDLALDVCKKAQTRIYEMRKRLEQKLKLDTQRWQLEQEEERLKPIKKGLSEPQKKLLETQKNLKDLPRVYAYDPESMNQYDTMSLDLTKQMLKIALDNKSSLKHKRKLKEKEKHVYTKKERLAIEGGTADALIKDILRECMKVGNVENPYHLHEIAEQLHTGDEWELAYPVIEKARQRIGVLVGEYKQRAKDKEKLQELQKERDELLKGWNLLTGEKKAQLDQLEFDNYVFEHYEPTYKKNSPIELDALELKAMKLLLDNMMTQHREDKVPYDTRAKELLDSVEKPANLYQLARHIERNWKNANEVVLKFGEKCQNLTERVEKLRQKRAPLVKEYNELNSKISDLEARNRDVRKDDKERLADLKKKIAELPDWPEYANLDDPYQYDQLNLDVVRVMISAILNNKTAYEEKIAKMRQEHDPKLIDEKKIEADRVKIHKDIQNMVKQCLERFANPADLLKVCKDMKNRKEVDIVLQISVKGLQRIVDIEAQRTRRNKVVERLEKARKDGGSAADKKNIAKLEKQLTELPGWPHYAKLDDPRQYNGIKYEIVKVALEAVLEHQEKVEADISHQYYMDKKGVDEKKINEKRAAMQANINQIVELINTHIKDANLLFAIARDLSQKKQASIILKVAAAFYAHVRNLEKIRSTKEKRDTYYQVLQDEKRELQRIKKELPENLEKEREKIEKEIDEEKKDAQKKRLYPDDMGNADTHAGYVEDFSDLMVRTSFATNEAIEKQIKDDKEKDTLTDARIAYLKGKVDETVQDTVKMLCENVHNPVFVKGLVNGFVLKELYQHAISLGLDSLDKKDKISELKEADQHNRERKDKLEKEKAELDKKRKKLSSEQTDELRELNLQLLLFTKQPKFVQNIEPQRLGLDIAKELVTVMSKAKTAEEQADKVVNTCLEHMSDVVILIEFTKYLINETEYRHAIKAGKKCEARINEFYADLEKREKLEKEIKELEEQRLKMLASGESDAKKTAKINERITKAKSDFENLPELDYDRPKLDAWILEISEQVVNAAKILDDDDTLTEQTVMAFKIDTSIERWDNVRNMVSDESWDKIKKELVVFVLQRDDNPIDKIELLMKDGLFEYCVKLFPQATGKDKELDLLVRLWKEVEENEPAMLEQFIPIVSRYMKRYYQEHKYEIIDPLLDRVAHWYPSVVVDLYKQACDMVLLWILPSQYTRFCDALKKCQKRLVEDLKRPNDWDDLVRDIKRQHHGKRKLLQMLLAIVDDPDWNLDVVVDTSKKKGM